MQNKKIRFFLITLLFFLYPLNQLKGIEKGTDTLYTLKLSSIGFPTAEKQKEARAINDLRIFKDKLYIGYGNAVANTGPTDIIYYDLKIKDFINEFTVDDEAIYKYQVIDNKLVIPGPDATEDWKFGNIYILTDDGWIKKRTIPNGIHINKLTSFDNKWYVATGNYFEFGKENLFAFGGILCSEDEGDSWKLVYASPTDNRSVFRIGSIITYQNKLYVFPYAFRGMKQDEIPEEYRNYLSQTYQNQYLIFTEDPLGPSDVIVFDGKSWHYIDLIKTSDVCYASPFIFKGKLVMSVIEGKFVDYLSLKNRLPENASSFILVFDGDKTVRLPFVYDIIQDVLIKKDRLFLLILKGDYYFIAETKDLEKWRYYAIPSSVRKPVSVEFNGSSFYIGTEDGNIFKSIGIKELSNLASLDNEEPLKFYGAAQLPREGKWYWTAITGWERWGKLAKITCAVRKKNLISVKTENVSSLSIFIPFDKIKKDKPVELWLNNEKVFKDTLGLSTELICNKVDEKQWKVEKTTGTAETFQYKKKIIGIAETKLTKKGDNSSLGSFVADVMKWRVSADGAIIPCSGIRKDLKKGDIALETLFDLTYPDTIWTFRVKGAELYRMMDFNIKQVKSNRCQISGFTFTYKSGEKLEDNSVVETSLDPAKDYTIATTGYLVKKMQRFLGDEVNCENSKISIYEAMMRWFGQFEKVKAIKLRIKRIGVSH